MWIKTSYASQTIVFLYFFVSFKLFVSPFAFYYICVFFVQSWFCSFPLACIQMNVFCVQLWTKCEWKRHCRWLFHSFSFKICGFNDLNWDESWRLLASVVPMPGELQESLLRYNFQANNRMKIICCGKQATNDIIRRCVNRHSKN